jgi:hypothetical protein
MSRLRVKIKVTVHGVLNLRSGHVMTGVRSPVWYCGDFEVSAGSVHLRFVVGGLTLRQVFLATCLLVSD